MGRFWMLVLLLAGCTERLPVLEQEPAPPPLANTCTCEPDELCTVAGCVDPSGITRVAVGYRHTCRIADGRLACWGENRAGQLGQRSDEARNRPAEVGEDADWLEVCAGEEHTCAIASPGRLFCWGNNMSGQLGTGNEASQRLPVRVESLDSVRRVACGGRSTCALLADARLFCWGANVELFSGSGDLTGDVINMPAEMSGNGNSYGQVSLGAAHGCAVRRDRTLLCWGSNATGQLGLGSVASAAVSSVGDDQWTQVAAAQQHTCAVRSDARLYCWGSNQFSQLGLGASEAGSVNRPERLPDDGPWQSVAVGEAHSCALRRDRALYCWGGNRKGQLGRPLPEPVGSPIEVMPSMGFRSVGAGYDHTCAIDTADRLYCWGDNGVGQLGVGDNSSRYAPAQVE